MSWIVICILLISPAKQKAQRDRLAMLREVMRCRGEISDLAFVGLPSSFFFGCVTIIKSWVFGTNEGARLNRGMF